MQGKLIIFSAPSGAGKTTIVHHLLQKFPELSFSISATTRELRGTEKHENDYYFITKEEFLHKVAHQEFVEFEEVYNGTFYGTLRSEIERIWNEGKHVIFDIDVEGGIRLKRKYEEDALAIFVQPPSLEVLKERLSGRGTDSPEKLQERFIKAEKELLYADKFDVILKNFDLATACAEAEQLVGDFLKK
ncbi:guanylate kinase [Pedobacter sp. HDW13]|uniref:guanylate kinase n=1 Tax=unclassified Pedobacter TaxID=2628915 RepID=UPI000F5AF9D0|nr:MULTISPECIES: guanylate kinase [unclassified Pedobacter]QIL39134.1 guanylate kinase [Pedobacter sp. HDW13]RQO63994.1 guanylate kinase [Pedobacter sp. KBW01]